MVKEYIQSNKDRFIEELCEWLRIPSVSADTSNMESIRKAAQFIKGKLLHAGCNIVDVVPTKGNPIVFAEMLVNPKLPTVLVYGHYDVQPPDPIELWTSPPFEPVIKEGKIYARGASDDKGQAYMHVKALEALTKFDRPCNVKFLFEGEEEVGSVHLGDYVKANKRRLQADTILISDTTLVSMDTPSITMGLRGLSYVEVEVTGPNRDLHSGVYGGAVGNPINVLCTMLGTLIDKSGKITIPGFYDDVKSLTKAERSALNKAPFDLEEYKHEIGIKDIMGEEKYTTLERVGIRPTLDINGIWGGYTGEGAKTVLPSKAHAKISMRLVPDQDDEKIVALFTEHFLSIAPSSVSVNVKALHGGKPIVAPTDSIPYKAASNAFLEVFGKTPIPMRDGGSIPIVAMFKEELGLDAVLMGFGLDSDAIHSPNEHFGIENFLLGIETIFSFYQHFGALKKEEG